MVSDEKHNTITIATISIISEISHGVEEIRSYIMNCIDNLPGKLASVKKAGGGTAEY